MFIVRDQINHLNSVGVIYIQVSLMLAEISKMNSLS